MITGKELAEKLYSENYDEYEDTRLYSTGDDELDDLLERAFCEGYEYAQREFNSKTRKAIKRAEEIAMGKSSENGWDMALYNWARKNRSYPDLDDAFVKSGRLIKKGKLEDVLKSINQA